MTYFGAYITNILNTRTTHYCTTLYGNKSADGSSFPQKKTTLRRQLILKQTLQTLQTLQITPTHRQQQKENYFEETTYFGVNIKTLFFITSLVAGCRLFWIIMFCKWTLYGGERFQVNLINSIILKYKVLSTQWLCPASWRVVTIWCMHAVFKCASNSPNTTITTENHQHTETWTKCNKDWV